MQRRIRYRMELYVLTDYFVFFAVNDNFNVSVIKTERIQSFGQFNRIQADEFGLFVATIDNGRNAQPQLVPDERELLHHLRHTRGDG